MTRAVSIAGNIVFAVFAVALGLGILALTVLPPVLKYQTYVVLSGSMSPAIPEGAVVIATAASPESLKVGDVITYLRPGDQENVTHRIVAIKGNAQGPVFVTQGDANGAPDQAEIRYDRLAGKVRLSVPFLGYAFKFIGSPQLRFVFIVVPGMLLLGSWLWELWKPEAKGKGPDEEMAPGLAPAPSQLSTIVPSTSKERGLAADAAAVVPLRQ